MNLSCPGAQNYRQPKPEVIKCSYCTEEVEIWTDEASIVCPKCKKPVTRNEKAVCLNWCSRAKECVGKEIFNRFMKIHNKGGHHARKSRKRLK